MNQLEDVIIKAVKTAQRDYENMTGGWWLSHGPESFLMSAVASKISKKGEFWVFLDASPKKIQKELKEHPRGRPRKKNQGKRFDLVVWKKASEELRAILEIKRAWNIIGLRADRKKMAEYVKSNKDYDIAAYLLAYTEARRENTLSNRLKSWTDRLDCTLVASSMDCKGDGEWVWAAGLFRLKQ
jgi:hypothetical protein